MPCQYFFVLSDSGVPRTYVDDCRYTFMCTHILDCWGFYLGQAYFATSTSLLENDEQMGSFLSFSLD